MYESFTCRENLVLPLILKDFQLVVENVTYKALKILIFISFFWGHVSSDSEDMVHI